MQVLKKIILCVVALSLTVCSTVTVSAANTDDREGIIIVEELTDGIVDNDSVMPLGVELPSTKWDLSLSEYEGSIEFTKKVYSNNLFTGHDGNFHITIDTTKTKTNPNISSDDNKIRIYICTKGWFGMVNYISLVKVEIGTARGITFKNYDPDTEYFITFEQPDENADYPVTGTFVISKLDVEE